MKDVLEAALRAIERDEGAALVTVVSTEGATPQKAGAKMVVYADGRSVGTIGGGCVEAELTWRARQAIESRKVQLAGFELTPEQAGDDGLVCGGRMQVLIEPLEAQPTLCLFGAGHVAQPLARMAKQAGFRVEVADDRIKLASRERFPDADRIVVEDYAAAAERLTLGRSSYAVVLTRGHGSDARALEACLARAPRFVGLLASRQKAVHVFAALQERGLPPEALERVHAPLGLGIGATTPEEIAVSILAELIAVRRGVEASGVRSLKMEMPGRLKAGG